MEAAIRPTTILVAIMYGNNEIGVVQPIREISAIAKRHGVLFLQMQCRLWERFLWMYKKMVLILMAFTAHKMYGPKGIGALYVRR